MRWSLVGEFYSFFILFILFLRYHWYERGTAPNRRRVLFTRCLLLSMSSIVVNVICVLTINHVGLVPVWFNVILNTAYFLMSVLMCSFLAYLLFDATLEHVYDKHCLSLSKEEVEANLAAGKPYVIRQNNPQTGTTTFHDEIYGDITVDNAELDDMILIKSDGYPTYNFANVVDDHLMGITHVVRGNEYLSSSPKYNRLYEAFGWEVPTYVHCPLITDETHKKLSKRCGHSSYEDLVEQGFLTEAIVNFVALLGWSPEDDKEIFSLEELVKA